MFVPRIRPFAHEILPLLPIEPSSSAEMADHDGETSSDIREPFNKTLLHLAQPGQSCTDDDGRPLIDLDQRQEARLRRKMDLHIVPVISIMYMFCFLDRVNLGNAKIAGLEKDLGLEKFDYNFLIMATYVPYAVLEPPITLLIKKVGPGRIIPVLCVLFGVVTLTFAFVTDFTGAIVNRVFLGLFEASIIPGLSYYLSRWYRRTEVTIRIACFLASGSMSGAVGGLLASAILTENAIGSIKGWRMIFLIEGLITIIIGLLAVYLMPDSIETAGWLSEGEKALALVRLKSERVACLGVVDAMRKKLTRQGMLLPHAYLLGVAQMIPSLTAQAAGFMLPTLVRIIFHAKTVPQQQLLSAPPYFVGSLLTLLVAYLSTKHARFGVFILGNYLLAIIGCSILVATTTGQPRLRYAALFLCVPAAFIAGPLGLSCLLANCNSDSERAGAIAVSGIFTHSANIVSAWYYLPDDAPDYHRANIASLSLWSLSFVLICVMLWNFHRQNVARSNVILEGPSETTRMSASEKELLGNRHPAFRYIL